MLTRRMATLAVVLPLASLVACLDEAQEPSPICAPTPPLAPPALVAPSVALTPPPASPAAATCPARGFNPCDGWRQHDSPVVAAVCERIRPWSSAPPEADTACDRVVHACQEHGYYNGGYEHGRGLYFNCVTPLLLGQGVCDVPVDPHFPVACMSELPTPPPARPPGQRSPRWRPWRGDPSDPLCAPLMRACNEAGFYENGYVEDLGIFTNCRDIFTHGGTVQGIAVSEEDVQRCKAGGKRH